ncbi:AbrB/MazE/SpoVT family DNA-binding domain-containing protein [Aquibacillus koreensis]|uniref:AbrB/MazE/SpoVT family DNA-binding domain-containing protein n=1 Tax=Aquibacillus koreensis TaxID=279446 RepID=A0A9X3WSR4_9BACI|nr:AbrB/MazE/SpoVT family DNA-binding domain-containing protein [Aquibacillus koreensis]MCT2537906.1 AbrB/MazE/SpoVT family DNA-binding domain-containing protein [Aquibacillus koreensis]MDC3422674.1 AbrB/MazE/SpoVT family DNA-binding domain-containing protein [Aquibacillus koreensis]
MKSTGMVRNVDPLGRVVIPKELRTVLNIHEKDPLEIFTEEDKIILRKFRSNLACQITGEVKPENQTFCDGKIVLSPEGIEYIKKELQDK